MTDYDAEAGDFRLFLQQEKQANCTHEWQVFEKGHTLVWKVERIDPDGTVLANGSYDVVDNEGDGYEMYCELCNLEHTIEGDVDFT